MTVHAPHTATITATAEAIRLPHSHYSTDLVPCDYHVLGSLKEDLSSRKFISVDEVKEAVQTWIRQQSENFSQGMKKLNDTKTASICRVTV